MGALPDFRLYGPLLTLAPYCPPLARNAAGWSWHLVKKSHKT